MNKWYAELKNLTEAVPGTAPQSIKVISGDSMFVINYTEGHGWCVYNKQPGASKAQLWGKPQASIKDAFILVASGL